MIKYVVRKYLFVLLIFILILDGAFSQYRTTREGLHKSVVENREINTEDSLNQHFLIYYEGYFLFKRSLADMYHVASGIAVSNEFRIINLDPSRTSIDLKASFSVGTVISEVVHQRNNSMYWKFDLGIKYNLFDDSFLLCGIGYFYCHDVVLEYNGAERTVLRTNTFLKSINTSFGVGVEIFLFRLELRDYIHFSPIFINETTGLANYTRTDYVNPVYPLNLVFDIGIRF